MSIPLPNKKYKIIYADPPWEYDDPLKSKKVWGNVTNHYDTMSVEDICKLPVNDIAENDCMLFLWGTWPQLPNVMKVMESWGFEYKSIAFVWVKTFNGRYHRGMGRWTRSNTEFVLLGKKGKPKRMSCKISQLVVSPVNGHSKKPDKVRQQIVRLMGDIPRIELFARTKVHGWDVWGNDEKLQLEPLEVFFN